MKNLWFILFLGLIFGGKSIGQVNLDQPVRTGISDEIFLAVGETNTYYFMPSQLCRNSEVVTVLEGERLIATFQVGICPLEFQKIRNSLKEIGVLNPQIRVMRGVSANTEKMSLRSIYPSFDPRPTQS